MARNEEKHAGKLNRLWLQKLDEEKNEKNPPRPGLGSLKTAAEVKKWMPSIKKDIDFYLKQSQVGCYPERKISEFSEKIESLSREYKAYLRKYRELEGNRDMVPWSDKPYARKHKLEDVIESATEKASGKALDPQEKKSFVPLSVPILNEEDKYQDLYGYNTETSQVVLNVNHETENAPLVFNWNKNVKALEYDNDCIKCANESEKTKDVAKGLEAEPNECSHCVDEKCGSENITENCSQEQCMCFCRNGRQEDTEHAKYGSENIDGVKENGIIIENKANICHNCRTGLQCCKRQETSSDSKTCNCLDNQNSVHCLKAYSAHLRTKIDDQLMNTDCLTRAKDCQNVGSSAQVPGPCCSDNGSVRRNDCVFIKGSDGVMSGDAFISHKLNLPYSDSSSSDEEG